MIDHTSMTAWRLDHAWMHDCAGQPSGTPERIETMTMTYIIMREAVGGQGSTRKPSVYRAVDGSVPYFATAADAQHAIDRIAATRVYTHTRYRYWPETETIAHTRGYLDAERNRP